MRRPLEGVRRVTGDSSTHPAGNPATDYGADTGEPICASFAGTLSLWSSERGGNSFTITAPGVAVSGQHLDGYARAAGLVVEGEVVGSVGNTGTATTGPHLHYYIVVNGRQWAFEEYLASIGWASAPAGGTVLTPIPIPERESNIMGVIFYNGNDTAPTYGYQDGNSWTVFTDRALAEKIMAATGQEKTVNLVTSEAFTQWGAQVEATTAGVVLPDPTVYGKSVGEAIATELAKVGFTAGFTKP